MLALSASVQCFPGFVWCTEKQEESLLCDYLEGKILYKHPAQLGKACHTDECFSGYAYFSSSRKISSISGDTRTRGYRDVVACQGWNSQNEDHWVAEASSCLLAEAS